MTFPEINSIRLRRQKLGLKQKELALQAEVSQSLIAKLEKGKIEPSYSTMRKIFSALDMKEFSAEKKCSEIMTIQPRFISARASVKKASALMKQNNLSQLPVMDLGHPVGSISESTILNKLLDGVPRTQLFTQKVSDIMDDPFPLIRADSPITIAHSLLKTSPAILLTERNKVVGIITKSNIL